MNSNGTAHGHDGTRGEQNPPIVAASQQRALVVVPVVDRGAGEKAAPDADVAASGGVQPSRKRKADEKEPADAPQCKSARPSTDGAVSKMGTLSGSAGGRFWNEIVLDPPRIYTAQSRLLGVEPSDWEQLLEQPTFSWDHLKHYVSKWYCVRLGNVLWLSWSDISSSVNNDVVAQGMGTNVPSSLRLLPCFVYDSVRAYTGERDGAPDETDKVNDLLAGLLELIQLSCDERVGAKAITVRSVTFLTDVMMKSDIVCNHVCLQECIVPCDRRLSEWLASRPNLFFRSCTFQQAAGVDDNDVGSSEETGVERTRSGNSSTRSATKAQTKLGPSAAVPCASSSLFASMSDRKARLERLVIWSPKGMLGDDEIPFLTFAIRHCVKLKDLEICDYDSVMQWESWKPVFEAVMASPSLEKVSFRGFLSNSRSTVRSGEDSDAEFVRSDDGLSGMNDCVQWLCRLIDSAKNCSRLYSVSYKFPSRPSESDASFRFDNTPGDRRSSAEPTEEQKINAKQLWSSMAMNGRISHLDLDWHVFNDRSVLSKLTERMDINRQRNMVERAANYAASKESTAVLGRMLCHPSIQASPELMFHAVRLTNSMLKDCWNMPSGSRTVNA